MCLVQGKNTNHIFLSLFLSLLSHVREFHSKLIRAVAPSSSKNSLVYMIPLFCGKIISAGERGRKESRCRCALYSGTVNRSKPGGEKPEISAGRLVLSYDVDKTSRKICRGKYLRFAIALYHAASSRIRAARTTIGPHANNQRNARNAMTVNSDQRKRTITRSARNMGARGSQAKAIVVLSLLRSANKATWS